MPATALRPSEAPEPRKSSAPEDEEEWLSAPDAAKLLGISSPNTLKSWVNAGHFPGDVRKTPTGRWGFNRRDVLELKRRMEELHRRNRSRDLMPPDGGDEEPDFPL